MIQWSDKGVEKMGSSKNYYDGIIPCERYVCLRCGKIKSNVEECSCGGMVGHEHFYKIRGKKND